MRISRRGFLRALGFGVPTAVAVVVATDGGVAGSVFQESTTAVLDDIYSAQWDTTAYRKGLRITDEMLLDDIYSVGTRWSTRDILELIEETNKKGTI